MSGDVPAFQESAGSRARAALAALLRAVEGEEQGTFSEAMRKTLPPVEHPEHARRPAW